METFLTGLCKNGMPFVQPVEVKAEGKMGSMKAVVAESIHGGCQNDRVSWTEVQSRKH